MKKHTKSTNIEKPTKSIRLMRTMRRLFGMAKQYRWAAWVSAVLVFISGLLQGAVVPLCLALACFSVTPDLDKSGMSSLNSDLQRYAQSISNWINLPQDKEFLFFVGLFGIAYLIRSITYSLQLYLSQLFTLHVIFALRTRLHAHLLRLSSAFFESQRTGDLMSRTTGDVAVLQHLVNVELVEAIRSPVITLVALGAMFKINAQLTLLTLIVAPFIAYIISLGSKKIRAISRDIQRRLGQVNSHLQERLSAVRIVQIFTREEYEVARFRSVNEANIRANLRSARVNAMLNPGIEFLAFVGMLLALLFAGWQMLHNTGGVIDLFTYLVLAQQAGAGLIKLGKLRIGLEQALAAGERVFEVLDRESDIQEDPDPIHFSRLTGQVDFCNVSFRYTTGEEVLKNINLSIAPGEMVALVVPSGAGKTSLSNLIPRFYDPTGGHIEVDGTDIRRVSLHSLRSQIGIVPQETILFAGTIYENIAYGKLEATRDEVIAAARAANADEFICAMPEGYDSPVGERGVRLSGGQRQRIAIARALLKDPRILILDEAMSSLDTKSEALVQEALNRLMLGRTTLVIAHRLSTVRNADRILVLSDGQIVEEGRHEQLLAAGGLYNRLYNGDFSAAEMSDEPVEISAELEEV